MTDTTAGQCLLIRMRCAGVGDEGVSKQSLRILEFGGLCAMVMMLEGRHKILRRIRFNAVNRTRAIGLRGWEMGNNYVCDQGTCSGSHKERRLCLKMLSGAEGVDSSGGI